MSVKIRFARWGAKKHPYYHIVVADSRFQRDGRFIKVVGKYDPMQSISENKLIKLDHDEVKKWLSVGAQPTEVVRNILVKAKILAEKPFTKKTKKSLPKSKAQERIKEKEAKLATLNSTTSSDAGVEGVVASEETS